jgi:hypothetical protein
MCNKSKNVIKFRRCAVTFLICAAGTLIALRMLVLYAFSRR